MTSAGPFFMGRADRGERRNMTETGMAGRGLGRFCAAGLPVTTAVAALSACSPADYAQDDVQMCRDQQGRRVADANCQRSGGWRGGSFVWVYAHRGDRIPRMGQSIRGFSDSPRASASSTSGSRDVTRGGFGSSARSSGYSRRVGG